MDIECVCGVWRRGTYGAVGLAFKVLGQGGAGSSEEEHGALHGDVWFGVYGFEEQDGRKFKV